jgi:hypothetical protein
LCILIFTFLDSRREDKRFWTLTVTIHNGTKLILTNSTSTILNFTAHVNLMEGIHLNKLAYKKC